jgi:hypothetical protein
MDILDVAAAIADKVVVPRVSRVEPSRAPFHGNFPHQTGVNEVPQIVIDRCAGGAGVNAIHSLINFRGRWMTVALHQEGHDGIALRGATQSALFQGLFDGRKVHCARQ